MATALIIIFLILAIITALVAAAGIPSRIGWGWIAVAFIAAAFLVPHLGLH